MPHALGALPTGAAALPGAASGKEGSREGGGQSQHARSLRGAALAQLAPACLLCEGESREEPVSRVPAGAACPAEQLGGWCACTPPAPPAPRVPRDSDPWQCTGRCRAPAGAEAWSASPWNPPCRPGPWSPGTRVCCVTLCPAQAPWQQLFCLIVAAEEAPTYTVTV